MEVESLTCTVSDLSELLESGKQFGCIYVDPPWRYRNQGTRASTHNHYPTMTIEEIIQLPVSKLAAPESHLHLWTTNAFLYDALNIIDSWGFEFEDMLAWVKPQMGLGNYWRVSHELLLLGVRGGLAFKDHNMSSWFEAKRTQHSRKPERVREMLEKVSPPPYLELFARQTCPKWTSWGNQIEPTLF